MNASIEGADASLKAEAEKLGIKVDGRWNENRIAEEIAKVEAQTEEEPTEDERLAKYTDMAKRQWDGQATDLPVGERISRLRIAAKKHNYLDLFEAHIGDILNLDAKARAHI